MQLIIQQTFPAYWVAFTPQSPCPQFMTQVFCLKYQVFKGELHQFNTSKCAYRSWGVLLHVKEEASVGAAQNQINVLEWWHLSQRRLGLKMTEIWRCVVRKKRAYQTFCGPLLISAAGQPLSATFATSSNNTRLKMSTVGVALWVM